MLSIDPTFELGAFSVTTTTYEHLNLIDRRSGVSPVMIGPLLISPEEREGDIQNLYRLFAEFKTTAAKLASSWNRWQGSLVFTIPGEMPSTNPSTLFQSLQG